jgi:hypothetical protein
LMIFFKLVRTAIFWNWPVSVLQAQSIGKLSALLKHPLSSCKEDKSFWNSLSKNRNRIPFAKFRLLRSSISIYLLFDAHVSSTSFFSFLLACL